MADVKVDKLSDGYSTRLRFGADRRLRFSINASSDAAALGDFAQLRSSTNRRTESREQVGRYSEP